MTNITRIKHRIARAKKRLEKLEDTKLSVHGHWSVGYYSGKLDVLYDWLDMLESKDER